jgi:glycosyltransferase involved in cell wall biosynthesis
MAEYLRLDPARVQTLCNLLDVERIDRLSREPLPIERREGAFTIVHAGRMSRQKNQRMLLDALGKLSSRNFELWMLGAGPLLEDLQDHARRLGIADRIRWLGFQENPYPFFRAADCFALSSLHEGSPNALIEAMLCGTVAVSTRCRYGPDEVIEDGVTGRLTRVGAVDEFAAALREIMDSPEQARQLAAAGRDRTRLAFDTQRVSQTYMELFERVARERAS